MYSVNIEIEFNLFEQIEEYEIDGEMAEILQNHFRIDRARHGSCQIGDILFFFFPKSKINYVSLLGITITTLVNSITLLY